MKKILISGLTLLLLLGLASVSMASTVYMDVMSGGNVEQNSLKADLSQISVGINLPLDEFKLDCNLTTGTINKYYDGYVYTDVDTSSLFLKGGYALVNDKQLRLDVTGGFYNRVITYDYYGDDEDSFSSLMIGCDAKLKLNRKVWVDFSYAFGLNPQGERYNYYDRYHNYNTYTIDSISLLNCKFNLLLTREFGASLGYTCETIDFTNSYKEKYSGITVGAFFKF